MARNAIADSGFAVSKHVRWLYDQLPELVDRGVLTAEVSDRIVAHYGPVSPSSARNTAMTVCAAFGSLLIGAGVILLLAHNWEEMSRFARVILAIAPLAGMQAAGAWVLTRKPESAPWREGVGAGISLAVAASIALIGQTYHIPGDLGGFLLVWSVATLPVMYLFDATLPYLIYLACIVGWSGHSQAYGGHAAFFWLLLAAAIPHVWLHTRRERAALRTAWEGWIMALCLTVAVGIVMEKVMPALWVIVYASMFALFFQIGARRARVDDGLFRAPFRTTGALGAAVLAFLLSFDWPWREVSWHGARLGAGYWAWAAAPECVASIVLPAVAFMLALRAPRRQGRAAEVCVGLLPVLAVAGYALASWFDDAAAAWLFNAYVLALGGTLLGSGLLRLRLLFVNLGMLLLAGLFTARFFDVDMPFAARGVVFIVIGAGFLGVNGALVRRRKTAVKEGVR